MNKILIAGAGAIGSVFGGFLRKKGVKVTLLGREKHLQAIRKNGLEIAGIWGNHRVEGFKLACSPEELKENYNSVILSVKSYDTETILRQILPFLTDDSLIISFQNGLGNMEKIAEIAGEKRTGGARIIFGTELLQPGKVRVTVYAEPVKIGALKPGKYKRPERKLKLIASEINHAGIPCEFTENIHTYLWAKLLYNCALNPLGAILKVKYGLLREKKESVEIMDNVIKEIFAVARAKGVKLFWDKSKDYRKIFYENLIPATYEHRSSMLQDLEKGKKTEIEAITGILCKYAELYGVETPVNKTLFNLIKGLEV